MEKIIDITYIPTAGLVPMLMYIYGLPPGNYFCGKTYLKINFFEILKNGDIRAMKNNKKNSFINKAIKELEDRRRHASSGINAIDMDISMYKREKNINNDFFVISMVQLMNLDKKALKFINLEI
jgi:hypothetical protein